METTDLPDTALQRHYAWFAVLMGLAIKAVLFMWGLYCFDFATYPGTGPLDIWNRWDALHYLRIAEHLYRNDGIPQDQFEFMAHFPPLYPLLIRVVALVTRMPYVYAGFAVAWTAGIASTYMLARIAYFEFKDARIALFAAAFFNAYPTAYFSLAPYSESVFILTVLLYFCCTRLTDRPVSAALCCAASILTRLLGLSLLATYGLSLLAGIVSRRFSPARLLLAVLPFAGFGIYVAINYYAWGDPLFFLRQMHSENDTFHKPQLPMYKTVTALITLGQQLMSRKVEDYFFETLGISSLFTTFVFLVTLWGACRRLVPWEYWVYSLVYILMFSSFSWGISNPRYSCAAFPVFMILARIHSDLLKLCLIVVSLGLQFYFAGHFVRGGWAY